MKLAVQTCKACRKRLEKFLNANPQYDDLRRALMKPKSHLTMTGYDAGKTLCGAEKDPNVQHYHAAYAPKMVLESLETCPQCVHIWTHPEEDDANGYV
jgi:hypothetical protein